MNVSEDVPVVEVNNENLRQIWPGLMLAIKHATFIALDTELSGLGSKKLLNAKNIEDRYKYICDSSMSRSILALGISCFKVSVEDSEKNEVRYTVQTFNILTMCMENFIIEPISVQFLIDHGFDFNKQFKLGLPYYRGDGDSNSKSKNSSKSTGNKSKFPASQMTIQQIINEMIINKSKIVFHNALIDLVFIYGNFFGKLPNDFATFVTDLDLIFGGGLFDTKFIAEFKRKLSISFLEYVFKRCKKDNFRETQNPEESTKCLSINFLSYPELVHKNVVYISCEKSDASPGDKQEVCFGFKNHGWCINGNDCSKSHCVDRILDEEDLQHLNPHHHNCSTSRKSKKRKKCKSVRQNDNGDCHDGDDGSGVGKHNGALNSSNGNELVTKLLHQNLAVIERASPSLSPSSSALPPSSLSSSLRQPSSSAPSSSAPSPGVHRAGFDAFMTGYIFATFINVDANDSNNINSSCNNNRTNADCNNSNTHVSDVTNDVTNNNNNHNGQCFLNIPDDYANKIYLAGKNFALQISRSNFTKPSKYSQDKLAELNGIV
ncbi:hypothetical protein HELRODRAFT_186759 [Helobdella robusta]|uniref:C3H1-type domain-containing protein n=1 Tax=Helobdella robusta TaxID=6412 RepID=T1FP30_HELRO|nr:hypothetical protein HELRODRAFT_186759 [Helobdella robusta]ESO09609.1 hypothetical protein HELRODRAFT_186759 [Helobdella robusta]